MPAEQNSHIKAAQARRIPNTFRALRHRNYQLWFVGQTISLIGTWMQTMAQQVLVYRLTGSATSLGIINFIALIPLLPLSLWGGSISDRFPKRKIIIAAQTVMLLQALLLSALAWSGKVQVWHVYALAMLLGAATAIDLPARQAFTVDMVEGKEDLTNAIALNSAMFNGARAIGPAMAGLVVAAIGEGPAFLVNALTFIAVIISLLLMRNLPQPRQENMARVSTSVHMAEGMRYVFKRREILVLTALVAVSAFLSMPYSTLMPVFADQILGASASPFVAKICSGQFLAMQCQAPEALPLGFLLTTVGIGAVIGALGVASLPDTARRGRWLTMGNLLFPTVLLAFSFSRSFALSLGLMLITGFSFVWQNALANTLIQVITSDEMRGRVMAFYTMTFQAMNRFGGLQAGFVADWISAPFSVGVGAAVSLLYGLYVAVRYPTIRRM